MPSWTPRQPISFQAGLVQPPPEPQPTPAVRLLVVPHPDEHGALRCGAGPGCCCCPRGGQLQQYSCRLISWTPQPHGHPTPRAAVLRRRSPLHLGPAAAPAGCRHPHGPSRRLSTRRVQAPRWSAGPLQRRWACGAPRHSWSWGRAATAWPRWRCAAAAAAAAVAEGRPRGWLTVEAFVLGRRPRFCLLRPALMPGCVPPGSSSTPAICRPTPRLLAGGGRRRGGRRPAGGHAGAAAQPAPGRGRER